VTSVRNACCNDSRDLDKKMVRLTSEQLIRSVILPKWSINDWKMSVTRMKVRTGPVPVRPWGKNNGAWTVTWNF
jgi:hypothetical protein